MYIIAALLLIILRQMQSVFNSSAREVAKELKMCITENSRETLRWFPVAESISVAYYLWGAVSRMLVLHAIACIAEFYCSNGLFRSRISWVGDRCIGDSSYRPKPGLIVAACDLLKCVKLHT